MIVSLFFAKPATILLAVHIENYVSGQTTSERFANKQRSSSITSSDQSVDQDIKRGRSCFSNFR